MVAGGGPACAACDFGAFFDSAVLDIDVVVDETAFMTALVGGFFASFTFDLIDRFIKKVVGLGLFRLGHEEALVENVGIDICRRSSSGLMEFLQQKVVTMSYFGITDVLRSSDMVMLVGIKAFLSIFMFEPISLQLF